MSESDQRLYDTASCRFRELWRDFKSLHRLKYAQYIVRFEGGLKSNPRGFFKYADMKRNASGFPSSMFLENDCAQDSQSIANLFAGIFQSVYVKNDWIPDNDLPTPGDGHKMSAIEVWAWTSTKDPTRTELHQLLKRLASVVKVPLTFVFNFSLSAGVFPAIWKDSFVVPLFKSGDKRNVSCYRGISIWSAIPKLFEKMVCDTITPVVRPVISDAQHGFVKGRSTVSNLFQFTNGVIGEIEDGWQVDGVYTNFFKAFDRVLHGMLKFNLSILFGGSLLCWMGSYLPGWTQRVKLENYLSESIQCHSGVLQGSHLGPIFFILDINWALEIFENVSVLGYADDLKLFMTIKCIGDFQLFQRNLDRLGEWCRSNKFDLNAGKCKSISFGRNMRPIDFVYSINGTALERVDKIKNLGVIMIMDGRMSFLPQIEAIICKSSKMLSFIKRILRVLRDPYTHKTLYTSLVRPNLEHAACVWLTHQSF
jgi:hypothetical protein